MKLAVGADHAGFPLKKTIIDFLEENGHKIVDHGTFSEEPVDFPVITKKVCQDINDGNVDRGLMICGTGVGASIAANKIKGIRASVCHDIYSAHQCVEHDNVNVMAIGAQIVGDKLAKDLLSSFLNAEFSTSAEFRKRVQMLEEMDEEKSKG